MKRPGRERAGIAVGSQRPGRLEFFRVGLSGHDWSVECLGISALLRFLGGVGPGLYWIERVERSRAWGDELSSALWAAAEVSGDGHYVLRDAASAAADPRGDVIAAR